MMESTLHSHRSKMSTIYDITQYAIYRMSEFVPASGWSVLENTKIPEENSDITLINDRLCFSPSR